MNPADNMCRLGVASAELGAATSRYRGAEQEAQAACVAALDALRVAADLATTAQILLDDAARRAAEVSDAAKTVALRALQAAGSRTVARRGEAQADLARAVADTRAVTWGALADKPLTALCLGAQLSLARATVESVFGLFAGQRDACGGVGADGEWHQRALPELSRLELEMLGLPERQRAFAARLADRGLAVIQAACVVEPGRTQGFDPAAWAATDTVPLVVNDWGDPADAAMHQTWVFVVRPADGLNWNPDAEPGSREGLDQRLALNAYLTACYAVGSGSSRTPAPGAAR